MWQDSDNKCGITFIITLEVGKQNFNSNETKTTFLKNKRDKAIREQSRDKL
jgi:hypothetical protein